MLFGLSRSALTKMESDQPTSLEAVLFAELIFGRSAHELFPELRLRLRRALVKRADRFSNSLRDRKDPVTERKKAFIRRLLARLQANT